MGEEAKEEQAKAEAQAEEKKEEKTEEKKEEAAPEPEPPSPLVLFVDLHCVGCAKKIEKSIMKIRGVEDVVIDMTKNHVTIKGVIEPQAVCAKVMKKTKRRAKVLSPLPAAEGEAIPEVVNSQVDGLTTVELNVNMHCEACAEQLKRKILKMRGVRTAITELSSGKVTVTGTMDANRLVDYVYRRTKKQAKIVPQPQPQPQPEPQPGPEKKEEEAKPEEKKEEAKPEEKKAEEAEKKDGGEKPAEEEKKKKKSEGKEENAEEAKKEGGGENNFFISNGDHEQSMQRMMHYYEPLYMIERIPPPQLFSDENPNACCIT